MRPLIALTTTTNAGAEYRTPQVMLGSPYIDAIERIGGTAVLVTPAHCEAGLCHLMEIVDGLVLTGGEDVDPSRYGQDPHPKLGTVNPRRDEMEFAALEVALARAMPVLAICRGLQLLNVAMGGTLYQDLPSQREQGLIHEQDAPITHRWHEAAVAPDSGLVEIFGDSQLFINSFHHQGIDFLAPGLRAEVWAEDGLIEGVRAYDYPWVVGVQWHPERGEAETEGELHPDARLFQAFGSVTRRFAEEGAMSRSLR
jgi:putative glutamine amidotransferase